MKKQRALLAGATGLIGSYCLDKLLGDDDFTEIAVLSRRPLRRRHDKLVEHVIDFERLADYGELIETDSVFCCLGTTFRAAGSRSAFERVDYSYVKQLAELAADRSVRRFLMVSAVGASPYALAFYSRVKGRAEEAVRALSFRTVHILRPSMLLGRRKERRWNEELTKPVAKSIAPFLVGPLRSLRPIHAEKVATMMVNLAKSDEPGVHIHYPSAC